MPETEKHIDEICAFCGDYEIIIGIGPYCHFHRKQIKRDEKKPLPGMRKCAFWTPERRSKRQPKDEIRNRLGGSL